MLTSYDFKAAGYAGNKGNETSHGVVTTCNFYGNSDRYSSLIYYYNEQADGTFSLADVTYGYSDNFTLYEKYAGYDLYKLATSILGGDPTTAQFWADKRDVHEGSTTHAGSLYIASKLKSYDLVYHNVTNESKKSVKYTAPLAQYGSRVPEDPYTDGLARTFMGWYADEACTTPFDFANSTMPHANVKVYAKWTVDKVTLTYDLNAPENPRPTDKGSTTFDPGTVAAQDVLPTALLYGSDYTFDGWYTPDGRLFDTATHITSDTTVIGRWLYNGRLSVTYLNGGATVSLDATAYADGSRAKAASADGLTAPDESAPYFLGWLMEDGTLVQPGESFAVTRLLAGEDDAVVLVAVWGAAEAATTIAYEPGQGVGPRVTNRLVNNEGVTLPSASDLGFEAPEGHVFAGWKAADGRGFATGDRVVVDALNEGAENVLTAQWAARTDLSYTVNYLWAGSDQKVAESKTVTGLTWGATPTEAPVEVDGYTPVDNRAFSFFLGEDDNIFNVYYYKNVELTAHSGTRVYDGSTWEVTGFEMSDDSTWAYFPDVRAYGSGVDVGEYPVTFSEGALKQVDSDGQYIVTAVHDGLLTVVPASLEDLATLETTDVEKAYDGTPLAAAQARVSVSVPGRPMSLDDGEAVVLAAADGYDAEGEDEGELEPTPEELVRSQLVVEYSVDGQAWTEDYASITATNVTDTMSVAAGNPVLVRVRSATDNLAGTINDVEDVVVTPRHLTLTAGSASKAFDGTALTTDAYELTSGAFAAADPDAPEGFESVTIDGSQTYVGSSESTIGGYVFAPGTSPDNYLVATAAGLLTVTDGTDDEPLDPGVVVTKTHDAGTYELGDEVTFALAAANIYDTPQTMTFAELDGVEITGQARFENVAPGAQVTTTARYVVTEADIAAGSFRNQATVTFEGGKSFEATDDVDVADPQRSLEVEKLVTTTPADGQAYVAGETVGFEVRVRNAGNQTLTGVRVTDKLAAAKLASGETELVGTLAPGQTATLHYALTVTEDMLGTTFANAATATADDGTTGTGTTPQIPVADKPAPTPVTPEPKPTDPAPTPEPEAPVTPTAAASVPKTGDATSDSLPTALALGGALAAGAGALALAAALRRRES